MLPPLAEMVCEYAEPIALLGREVVVIEGPDTIVIDSALDAFPLAASAALTEKPKVPVEVGVPEMTPSGLSESPGGSVPVASVHASGGVPPEAASVCEGYAVFKEPFGSDVVVIVRPLVTVIVY